MLVLPGRTPSRRRGRRALLPVVALAALTALGLMAPAASAATTAGAPVSAARTAKAVSAGVPSVATLAMKGATAAVTVHRVYRTGQAAWINHVLTTRFVDLDGCQVTLTPDARRGTTYRAVVHAVCPDGPARVEAAARDLVRSRPWYHVTLRQVPIVGFTLLADLPTGNARAVPAAMAQLPGGPSVFFEGDDVSLTYAGPGVSQRQLTAAVGAFAAALGIAPGRVTVSPLGA